jgi:hypothetical protein
LIQMGVGAASAPACCCTMMSKHSRTHWSAACPRSPSTFASPPTGPSRC